MRNILVIDDNPAVANALEVMFRLHEIHTYCAATPEQGLQMLARQPIDVAIVDMNFSADTTSGEEGARLFRSIRAEYPDLPVILLTAWTHLESAVELIKAGAADYLAKPWDNDKLLATVENLLELSESIKERQRLQRGRRARREQLAKQYDLRKIVFESEPMEVAIELACRVARAPVPVLITGPSGAGKEHIADLIHANSNVRTGPFIALNCGALPSDLIEAELFGAEAGAYTGATRTRSGRFELADGGTLFLDEIANLPLSGQAKLLRVLETGEYEPLGSGRTRSTRVRIVSATNADLPAMIRDGRFRDDLYYRLNVIQIGLPPLSERSDDILPLAEHFLGNEFRLGEDAQEALLRYSWPGNVRELRNAIERAKLLARDRVVSAADLGLPTIQRASEGATSPNTTPGELTKEAIEASLQEAGGNIRRAAQRLGISRQALYRRMERFGLRS